jgi:hypothetical protein
MYASFLRISRALHLDVFGQPVKSRDLLPQEASVFARSGRTLLWGALVTAPERMHRVQTLIRLTAPSLSTRIF